MSIAKNLKRYREAKNLSQRKLAEIAGLPQSLISHIEKGEKKNPGVIGIKKLADALGITMEELIESKGDEDEEMGGLDR